MRAAPGTAALAVAGFIALYVLPIVAGLLEGLL